MKNWPWSRIVILTIAAVAVAISGDTLAALALRLQWTDITKWGLPVCVDVLAVYAVVLWLHPQTPPGQREFARGMAWSMLGVSLLGNAVEHVWRASETSADVTETVLAIAWGSIPSVAAFLAIHLYALGTVTPKRVRKAATAPETPKPETPKPPAKAPDARAGQTPGPMKPPPPRTGPAQNPQPGPLHSVPPPVRRKPKDDAEVIEWLRARGGGTKNDILTHWQVGGGTALRILQAYREAA
jgi:hypothetical protein